MKRSESVRKPKVCRIITRLNIGGPSHHVTILNEGLDALGYETILIVGTEDKDEGMRPGRMKCAFGARLWPRYGR